MVMYWDKSAWLQGIEETMTLILKAFVEVIVLPQSWGFLSLFHHDVYQLVVYYLHASLYFISRRKITKKIAICTNTNYGYHCVQDG